MSEKGFARENDRLSRFGECHDSARTAAFGEPPDVDPEMRLNVRDFLIAAMKKRSWENHFYRANPKEYNIECALLKSLSAFDYPENPVRVYHLKQVRRFLFSRFAFGGAWAVNRRLQKAAGRGNPSEANADDSQAKEGWLWLYKDMLLPRMGFSIALGFAAIFGSSGLTWLDPLAYGYPYIGWPAALLILAVDWFLILLNVRNQIGKVPARWHRSLLAWIACLAWMLTFLKAGHCYYVLLDSRMKWLHEFSWCTAWLAGSIALLFGLLGQFFFGKAGSIAEPL